MFQKTMPSLTLSTTVLPGLTWPPLFVDFSLMVILIEKETTEMDLDIDRVIRYIFFT